MYLLKNTGLVVNRAIYIAIRNIKSIFLKFNKGVVIKNTEIN